MRLCLCGGFCDHDSGWWHKSECLEGHLEIFFAEHFSWERCHHAERDDAGFVALLQLNEKTNGCQLFVLLERLCQGSAVGQADLNSRLFVVFRRRSHGCNRSRSDYSHGKRGLACFSSTSSLVSFDLGLNTISGGFFFGFLTFAFLDLKQEIDLW